MFVSNKVFQKLEMYKILLMDLQINGYERD